MNGDERTLDDKTLGELYTEAGGEDDGELELDGVRFRKTVCGNVLVNDVELGELSSHAVEKVARALRAAAEGKYTDPQRNPLIRLGDD
jgi:hypothetical protein